MDVLPTCVHRIVSRTGNHADQYTLQHYGGQERVEQHKKSG